MMYRKGVKIKRPKGWPMRHAKTCPRSPWRTEPQLLAFDGAVCTCGVSNRRREIMTNG